MARLTSILISIIVFIMVFTFTSCTKEELVLPVTDLASDYLSLKKGNYWVAQKKIKFKQSNSFVDLPSYDSIYVADDTLIAGILYNKLLSYDYEVKNGQRVYERTNLFAILKLNGNSYQYTNGATYFTTDTTAKAIYANKVKNNITTHMITGKAYISGPSLKWEVKTFYEKSVLNSAFDLTFEDASFYLEKSKGFTKFITHGDLTNHNRDRVESHVIKSQSF
jgi:hypothetical protein